MTALLQLLAPGIHLWRATHPDWNTRTERVACYALEFGAGVLLVDPLLDADQPDTLLTELARLGAGRPVETYVTIPYHVRDSERVAREFGGRIFGHPALANRLKDDSLLVDARDRGAPPFGTETVQIGNPRRFELPLYSPTHRALALGDVAIGTPHGLRIWQDIEGRQRWFAERLVPSLAGLATLDVDHVLVGHGEPIIDKGGRAVREMLVSAPVASISGQLAGDAVR